MELSADYRYLLEHFERKTIANRLIFWIDNINIVIKNCGLDGLVRIDNDRLRFMILCYFSDIARLKGFHNIEYTHKVKVFAYSFYWFLRIMPVQITHDLEDKGKESFASINETIVLYLWLCHFLCPLGIEETLKNRYIEELKYFLKYRRHDAQTLEAMITALLVGAGKNPFNKEKPTPEQQF